MTGISEEDKAAAAALKGLANEAFKSSSQQLFFYQMVSTIDHEDI